MGIIWRKEGIIALILFIALLPSSYSSVLINEILANGLSDPEHEWVELYNNGTSDVNLTNWSISETSSSNFTFNATISAKSFIILAVDFSTFNSTYPNVNQSGIKIIDITISNFNLADTSGEVRLYNSSRALADSVSYVQTSGKTLENTSIGRYPDGSSAIFNLSTLTPGAKNDNKAPIINKWTNPSKNNTNISAITNITINITDDTVQVNSTKINFNGTNFSMAKNGDVWNFLWNTSQNSQKQYNITIFFNDSYGKSGSDTLYNILVNNSPYIVSFSPSSLAQTVAENSNINFNVSATDPDDAIDFIWFIDGKLNGTSTFNFSYSPDFDANGTHSVNVTVNDAASNQVSMKWAVIVTNFNRAPILGSISDKTFSKNINSSFNISANDFDNDTLTFSANHSGIIISKINNSAATISWKPTNRDLGKNMINFSVNDVSMIDSKLMVISVNITNNTPPAITPVPKTTASVNEEYSYDIDASDADNDILNFSIRTNASGMSIDSSSGLIIFFPQSTGFFAVNVSASDFTAIANQSFSITINQGSKLKIADVDVKIGSKKSNNVKNSTKIRKEANPGSSVEFKVEVKNDFLEQDDLAIEDIELKVTIMEIDEGDDLELEANDFDLDAQDDKKPTFKFDVPLNVDEDIYDVLIEAEGKDENGTVHRNHFEIELEVEKKKHDLRFSSFDLKPPAINCNRAVTISYGITNIGQEDEENAVFEVKSGDLNFTHREKGILINSGDDGNTFFNFLKIKIGNNMKKGTYPLAANVYSDDGKLRNTITKEIKIEDCVKGKSLK